MSRLLLKGITWNHSRALPPLVAAAQRFEEFHPNVRIVWEKRSLHEFGHAGVAELAPIYDLLVVDHPMMGGAAGALVNLYPLLQPREWEDLKADSAGPSFDSYVYKDALYALPIDAAAPAASFRSDLLEAAGLPVPTQWRDLLSLARRNLVRMPGLGADLFLNFMGMCVSRGSSVAAGPDRLFDHTIAIECLDDLRELASFMPETIYEWNPIALYETMSSSDDFAYCPFAYTYSNYSRPGFAARPLRFAPAVPLSGGADMRTVLGGTGLAISEFSSHIGIALEYSLYVASYSCQNFLYGVCGGQPARRSAWKNPMLNQLADGFFERTLPSIESAYVRPRYCGYISLQEQAGTSIRNFLRYGASSTQVLEQIDSLYQASLSRKAHHA